MEEMSQRRRPRRTWLRWPWQRRCARSSGSRADLDAEFDALAPDPLAGAKQTGDGPDPLSAALAAGGANDAGDGTETDLGDGLAAVPPAEAMHALGRSDDGRDGTKGGGSDGSDARRGGQLSPPATAETRRGGGARAEAPPGTRGRFRRIDRCGEPR